MEDLSFHLEHKQDTSPSMIYSILPAVVQNRIPTLPSIRRSVTALRNRAIHAKGNRIITITELQEPETPPPEYSGDGMPNRNWVTSTDASELDLLPDDISERPGSSGCLPPLFSSPESESGVNWRYANQGISLLNQAQQESIVLIRDTEDGSAILTRQLYLHGMSYLLRGIPSELTPEEQLSLQAAIPANLCNHTNDASVSALIPVTRQAEVTREGSNEDLSLLHRITATIAFQAFVLIQLILPYVKLFIGHAYRWERENKVTQRLFNNGIIAVDELSRRSLQLSRTVCQMNDGKVGQAINDMTLWWVRGVTGGIQQGISEGVVMFGHDRKQYTKSQLKRID